MEIDRLIRAFEMWIWRRIEKISWKNKNKHEEVLAAICEEISLVDPVVKQKRTGLGIL